MPSEDSDHTEWMPGLIWVFAGHTGHFVGFVWSSSIFGFVVLNFYLLHPSLTSPHSCTKRAWCPGGSPSTVPSITHLCSSVCTSLINPCIDSLPICIMLTAAPRCEGPIIRHKMDQFYSRLATDWSVRVLHKTDSPYKMRNGFYIPNVINM